MRKPVSVFGLFFLSMMLLSCKTGEENEFWGEGKPFFEVQQIFPDERFPNVIVAGDGTVLTTWGQSRFPGWRNNCG
jgi:hypothetical protein